MKLLIKKIAKRFGLVVKKSDSIKLLLEQRAFLINKLRTHEKKKLGLSCIIFSKDRALQLFALLESLNKNCVGINEINIIYTCSSAQHFHSYSTLIDEVKHVSGLNFIKESTEFKSTLEGVISGIVFDKLIFLVDDNIFVRPCDLTFLSTVDISNQVISLRLGSNISYSYTSKKAIKIPPFHKCGSIKGFYEFSWSPDQGEWGDPCSLDGHIYCTGLIEVITSTFNFAGPNSYEAGFKSYDNLFFDTNGICQEMPAIKNLALNCVQKEYKNRFGNLSSDYLLDKWSSGMKICLDKISEKKDNATHVEVNLTYIER